MVPHTLDQLYAGKPQIERELFLRLRDLFSLKADLVFYDVTSTYFEGHGPPGLGRHGYSRDGKPRDRQVLVGQVMVDGWPIAHHVFAGNWRDAATVPAVLRDHHHQVTERSVIVTAVPNTPGALAPALRMVSDAGINIEYAYGGGSEGSPTATIVLGVYDAERASAAAGV